jgi:hypothetical protein
MNYANITIVLLLVLGIFQEVELKISYTLHLELRSISLLNFFRLE